MARSSRVGLIAVRSTSVLKAANRRDASANA
jgi:hypothetical protein